MNSTENGREKWGSKIGFILAAAGSAIGLGNLWKFHDRTYTNDGCPVVLTYLMAIFAMCVTMMYSGIIIC